MNRAIKILCALLALTVFTGVAVAQPLCFLGDDGFNLGCCNPPQPNLPNFPAIQSTATYGCIRDCNLEAQFQNNISATFNWVFCDYATMNLTVFPSSPGAPGFSGLLLAKYSRTWRTTSSTISSPVQVWRFLINGDMTFGPTPTPTLSGCPVPPQTALGIPVHMVGSVDYICSINAAGLQSYRIELNLTHFNGCISHAPWSTFPLTGAAAHTNRSYHLVAPSNFAFVPVPEPMGGGQGDAARGATFNWLPFTYQCFSEARMQQFGINTVTDDCFSCGPTPTPVPPTPLYAWQDLAGSINCGTTNRNFNTIPVIGPGGLLTLRLGRYIPSTTNPSSGSLCVHFGVMQDTDPCSGSGPIHVVTGVTSFNPMQPASLFPTPGGVTQPPQATMMDLQNVKILPIYGTTPSTVPYIGWGSLFIADMVYNLNLP